MTLGEKIKYHRRKLNLTQDELAEKVGVSKSAISVYEDDKREPRFISVVCIADVLGVSLDYLAGKEKG